MKRLRLLFLMTLAAGCAVGPDYQRPTLEIPANFKEAGDWKAAEPRDEAVRGKWWEIFGDPRLNELVEQVAVSNENVRAAEAAFRQASALSDASRADILPALSGNASSARSRSATSGTLQDSAGIRESDKIALAVNWELDLWGRIRRGIESGDASAQASAADLQAALLSAQAGVTQTYIQLRQNETQNALLEKTVAAYQRSLEITRNRYEAGVAPKTDVLQAETQLKTAQAQWLDLKAQRAQLEHALAVGVGKLPAQFALAAGGGLPQSPPVPLVVPSALLERRPDIAGAERRMAAANAQIGVAQAAFFPALSLGGSGGYQGGSFSHLVSLPNRFWSFGPTLALTLFDFGARSAQKAQAGAAYDKTVANYRQTVLAAFAEVEDNLASLRVLDEEVALQQAAAEAAAETARRVENQYQAGMVGYLNVASAQTTALNAERSLVDVRTRKLLATVALLKAMGGGWQGSRD